MKSNLCRSIAVLGAFAALAIFPRHSQAQLNGILNSDVEGFFGSTSDSFQQSEAPIGPTWPAVGFSLPYPPSGFPIGTVPPLYGSFPSSAYPVVQNIPFSAPLGHTPSAPFTDGITAADYYIVGGMSGVNYTRNAAVLLGNNTGSLMYLDQGTGATGYAYEEVEFAIDYIVGSAGLLPGNPTNLRPYLVFGDVTPGGSAEFGAQLNYSFADLTGSGTVGTFSSLGTLQYQDYISSVSGPFLNLVTDTSYSTPNLLGAAPSTYGGILEITGDTYLIGDPVDINVESVPEPSSAILLVVALVCFGLAAFRRRRSREAGSATS